MIRGGVVSKSATKAPRGGIGREEKRGISTILLVRSGSIGAFVADLDNPPPRGPGGGVTGRRSRGPDGIVGAGAGPMGLMGPAGPAGLAGAPPLARHYADPAPATAFGREGPNGHGG